MNPGRRRYLMSEAQLSPETLAAFVDGTLDASEREKVLETLANSPDDYDALLDTVAVVDEMQRPPFRPGLKPARWRYVVPALAAAIILALILPGRRAPTDLVTRLASSAPLDNASTLEGHLGPLWDQPGWSVTRGNEISLSGSAVAFRLGARGVLYEAAARLSDRAAAAVVSAELRDLLRPLRGGAPVAALYAPELLDDTDSRAERGPALERVAGHQASFRLGAAMELLRLSIATDPSLSIPPEVPEVLTSVAKSLLPEQEDLRIRVDDLVTLLRSPEVDLEEVRRSMTAIVELAGG